MLLCEEGARDVCGDVRGGGEEMLYVPTKDADVYMKNDFNQQSEVEAERWL